VATAVTLTVTPSSDGFANAIQFTAGGVPSGWTAQFLSGNTITPGSSSATVTLTVTAPAATAADGRPVRRSPWQGLPSALGGLMGLMMAVLLPIRRVDPRLRRLLSGKVQVIVWLAILCATGFSVCGCGGGFSLASQNQQSVTITVTGASGTLQHSDNVTFVVSSEK
jgi:hypothetical protein